MIFAGIAIAAAGVTASAELSSVAELEVSRVRAGELWRLLSGHLAHLTWEQFRLDATAFVLSFATLARVLGLRAATALLGIAALAVSISVILAARHEVYGGLSGLSFAATAALIAGLIRDRPRRVSSWGLGLGMLFYLADAPGMASGIPVASEAHWAGAAVGLGFVVWHGSQHRPPRVERAAAARGGHPVEKSGSAGERRPESQHRGNRSRRMSGRMGCPNRR